MLKKVLLGAAAVLLLVLLGAGGFIFVQVSAFDASMAKVYDVPVPAVTRTTDPAQLERGKHLAESLGGCNGCHGANLAGGKVESMGPVATMKMPNLTPGRNSVVTPYSDGELARLIKHGIKRTGTSVLFMPSRDFSWWPDSDVAALVSYLRSLPPIDGEVGMAEAGTLGKVLDRLDKLPLDMARRIDHARLPGAPEPAETAAYGQHLSALCGGCHGPTLAGGPIPGAPPELPVPLNLTPHDTGLKGWTYEDFEKLMRTGQRKNGKQLDPFMPIESFKNFNQTEMKALFAYLQTVKPAPFGQR